MIRRSHLFLMLMLGSVSSVWTTAHADETDQFILPPRDTFTDLGAYIDLVHYRVLERIVDRTNERVEQAHGFADPAHRRRLLDRLHAPERLADLARRQFGQGWEVTRELNRALLSPAAKEAYPDQLIAYIAPDWIYAQTPFPLNPRRMAYFFYAKTIRVHGVYLGLDKIGHFFDLGHLYYKSYRGKLAAGMDPDEAMERTLRVWTTGLISESGIIGALGTGVNSNADNASNYLGMKFYLNLTEPVMLKGELHPPLLVRIGDFWALNQHVRPDSGFMAPFYSDHLNEALNPNLYVRSMRGAIERRLSGRRQEILDFYALPCGTHRTRACFEKLYEELSTYYGEPYGHSGIDPVATIMAACFPDEDASDDREEQLAWRDSTSDEQSRSAEE